MSKLPHGQRGQRQPAKAAAPTPAVAAEKAAQQVTFQQTHYQGDIPPPALLRQFDDMVPGTAARLIGWAEAEAEHRRAMERDSLQGNLAAQAAQVEIARYDSKATFRGAVLGQLCGLAVCILCVAGAIWEGDQGNTGVAIALAAIPTAAVIRSFGVTLPSFGRKPK